MRPEVPRGVELFPLDLEDEGGESDPCVHCTWWWSERVEVDGRPVLREWHEPHCPEYRSWSLPLRHDPDLRDALEALTRGELPPGPVENPPPHDTLDLGRGHRVLLADVLTCIDDGDPLDEGPGGDVSVWEDPDRLMKQIWDALAEPMGLVFYFRYTCPRRAATLSLASSAGLSPEVEAQLSVITRGAPVCGSVAESEAMEAHSFVHLSTDPAMEPVKALGVQSYASFPLLRDSVLIGTFAVGSGTRPTFTDHEVLVLRALAHRIVEAIDAAATR